MGHLPWPSAGWFVSVQKKVRNFLFFTHKDHPEEQLILILLLFLNVNFTEESPENDYRYLLNHTMIIFYFIGEQLAKFNRKMGRI